MTPVLVRKFAYISVTAVLCAITAFSFLPVRHAKPSIVETNAPDPNEEEASPSVSVTAAGSLPRIELGATAPAAPLTEEALMGRLRAARDTEPALAIELAREAIRRFPENRNAPERASILIHALAQLNRSSEARGEAENMVNRYPDSHWVREVEQFTGAHRHRNVRLDDAGQIEYFDP